MTQMLELVILICCCVYVICFVTCCQTLNELGVCSDAVSATLYNSSYFTVFSANSWMQTATSLTFSIHVFRHVFFFEGSFSLWQNF
jgi:hypothetical protein